MEKGDARRALLGHLIDHAPTFPPASLSPADSLAEDARAVAGPHSFALGRLVWPASRLGELAGLERSVSAVLDAPLLGGLVVEAVETRFRDALDDLAGLAGEVYVELPIDAALEERLEALAARGLRAKVRCGGEHTPSVEELARFVRACRERALVFKATAGLHHVVRSNGEHGFLNLLAAAVFAGDEDAALAEVDGGEFTLDATAFRWRERRAGAEELARVRRTVFHSIGSCSFSEPIAELQAIGAIL